MASIIMMTGTQKGEYYPLGRRTNVIGRDEALIIQMLGEGISRKHLRIRFDTDLEKYFAEDMNSKNGVFINNKKINEQTELYESDRILIGDAVLLFTFKDFADSEKALHHFKKVGERANVTKEIDEQ
jgi:pSer/pThr/pTyr-binding forkhead associated (FHA) protein